MGSNIVRDGNNVRVTMFCTACKSEWEEWRYMEDAQGRVMQPRLKTLCEHCLKRRASPTMLAAWERCQGCGE